MEHLVIEEEIDIEDIKNQIRLLLNGPEVKEEVKEEKPLTISQKLALKKAERDAAKEKTVEKTAFVIPDFNMDGSYDPNEIFEQVEALTFPVLKKFAKEIGVSTTLKQVKDEVLELVANRIIEINESKGVITDSIKESATEITKELVDSALESNDLETLISVCTTLGVKLSVLLKKSAKHMANKIYPLLVSDDNTSKKEKVKDETPDETPAVSIYHIIEERHLAGIDKKKIIKEVTPLFKDKTALYIMKTVTTIIEIVNMENS